MITIKTVPDIELSDSELVSQALVGNRHAFGRIVERYQNLICSLAYSATGSLTQSEDLSQETFVAAWKQLPELREHGKLRSWLCGIVRNLSRRSLRGQALEPVHAAEQIDAAHEEPAMDAHPLAQTISREEEAILWRALERLPETYREPLILFYREHQSAEQVALELELTGETVRQRLARGRKLLHEEVAAFVEQTLSRTAPGSSFSASVLAALPLAGGPAVATAVGVAGKGTAAAKTGLLAVCIAVLAPFLGILAGIFAQCLVIQSSSEDRRQKAIRMAQTMFYWIAVVGLAWGGEIACHTLADHYQWHDQTRFVVMCGYWWSYCCLLILVMTLMARRNPAFGCGQQPTTSTRQTATAPMHAGKLAVIVLGSHLMLFFTLIRLAWMFGDCSGACIITGAMLVLCVMAFHRIHGKTGADVARAFQWHMLLCSLTLLLGLNLRADVWVASAYHVSVGEASQALPTWIVPVLTLALIVWATLISVVLKSKAPDQSVQEA